MPLSLNEPSDEQQQCTPKDYANSGDWLLPFSSWSLSGWLTTSLRLGRDVRQISLGPSSRTTSLRESLGLCPNPSSEPFYIPEEILSLRTWAYADPEVGLTGLSNRTWGGQKLFQAGLLISLRIAMDGLEGSPV